ncbi:MAG: hypothetical protein LBB91_03330 [Clostridiales bacterium]|jgi:protein AbiQ|nr:hypothetical protein [Clostridiales bacterium]
MKFLFLNELFYDKYKECTEDEKYIDNTKKPFIRQNEFDSLRGKEYIIKQKLIKHISEYKAAKTALHIYRNKLLCQYSTVQYFEEYIKDIRLKKDNQ